MDAYQVAYVPGNEHAYINELERKLQMLTTFIDSAEAGMYVTDIYTGEILYANRKMVSLGGNRISPNMLIGQVCWKLINDQGQGRCPFCPYERLINCDETPQEAYVWEQFFPAYDLWLKVSSRKIEWVDGRLAQMNTFFDITETKRMQEQLAEYARETEHRRMQQNLQNVLDLLPIPVRITELATGIILYGNQAALELFGFESPEDVIGKSAFSFMPETQPDGMDTVQKAAFIHGDRPASEEFVCIKPDGEPLDLLITSCKMEYDGKCVSLAVMENLERERQYQKSRKDLQEILDKLPIPVRITEQESATILYANNECLRLFELDKLEDVIGRLATDFLPVVQSDGTDSREKYYKLLGATESLSIDIEYISSKGKTIDGRTTVCAIDFDGKKTILGIITDLAVEKERQRMLLSAAEKERESNQLKSSFLSNMSHEVRTPMNAIIGLTDIELNKQHPSKTTDVFRKINVSARNLLQIANDILDLSKIEADKLELFSDEFELEEALDSALLVVSPRLEGKRVEMMLDISLDLPRFMIGDRTRLWQILKNYLDNSAKYTQQGSIILTVAEDTTRSSADNIWVTFSVQDTGIGMDEEQLRKAFLPYEQVYNDAQKRYVGTGLGLPISKRLCELMGGVLNIESQRDQGTTVRFSIPFTRAQSAETERQWLQSLSGLRILAVDDGNFALMIIGSLLENAGADYALAWNGEHALKILRECHERQSPFDVILLDYLMEGMNGLETAQKIREYAQSSKLLMVTSYENSLLPGDLSSYGIDDIIEKPYVPSVFIHKIRSAVGLEQVGQSTTDKAFAQFNDLRVLVCEDNEINQEVALGMLEQFSISAVAANNGKHCLEVLEREGPFDMVLMDLHMPIMNGFDATRAIRANPKYNLMPIISLTADAMTEVTDKCMSAGMNGYLSKPIEMSQLNEIFQKWFPKKRV